jgi:hypothetical protein
MSGPNKRTRLRHRMAVYVDRFDTTLDITGKKRDYESVKARVLHVGKFSCFEASDGPKNQRWFTDLCRDPNVETIDLGYPWTAVRPRDGFRFRPHRGGYSESMAQQQVFGSIEELDNELGGECVIVRYGETGKLDYRNGWDTHIVSVNGEPVGFVDREVKR